MASVVGACGGSDGGSPLTLETPFFLEAEIVVEDDEEFGFQEETVVTLIRWWFQDVRALAAGDRAGPDTGYRGERDHDRDDAGGDGFVRPP